MLCICTGYRDDRFLFFQGTEATGFTAVTWTSVMLGRMTVTRTLSAWIPRAHSPASVTMVTAVTASAAKVTSNQTQSMG